MLKSMDESDESTFFWSGPCAKSRARRGRVRGGVAKAAYARTAHQRSSATEVDQVDYRRHCFRWWNRGTSAEVAEFCIVLPF